MSNKERTEEEIAEILTLAKLNKEDLLPVTQTIYFSPNTLQTEKNYKFLELNPKLQEYLKVGDVFYINGAANDDAVLCTKDSTYEILKAETSNSLLLSKDLKFSEDLKEVTENGISHVTVEGIFYDYLEVVQRKPHFQKLHEILEATAYKGPEHEYLIKEEELFTFEALWSCVQASKVELTAELAKLQTVTIDGKVRLLDFEYHFRVLSFMLKIIDENSWQLDEIDYEITIESLTDLVPLDILSGIFDLHAEETKFREGTQLYRYKEAEVCKFFAQIILYRAGKFNLREFLQAWQESVPEGMITEEEMLYGLAIIDRKSIPNVIWSFSENKLPQNITERLRVLFGAKEKWSVAEIAPYIENLTNDKLDVNALLTKHARPSTVDGIKYYSAKHSK